MIETFNKLFIPYYIGGSVASSVYGMARSTLDVDLIAAIKPNQVPALRSELENEYYIDEDMILDAIARKYSFNLVHYKSMVKIDVFIRKDEPFDNEIFSRKRKDILGGFEKNIECFFSSPEDIIIHKLKWYRDGNKISERQWLDVIGVIKVQAKILNTAYLLKWARDLDLLKLLRKAFAEAGISGYLNGNSLIP
ncbi:MAG TPA: hypothetical protein ENH29_10380 [Bacteroidetes bacterium]|nr:hypothetical protein [Bacteroidota bacterium]